MNDPLDRSLTGLDRPRRLDPAFAERLVRAVLELPADAQPMRWNLDKPRPLPAPLRSRIEAAILSHSRWSPRVVTTSVAAMIALLVVANSVVVVAHRRPPERGPVAAPVQSTSPTPLPSASPATAIRPPGSLLGFHSAADFLGYVERQALKLAGPYGIRGGQSYGGDVVVMPVNPGSAPSSGGPPPVIGMPPPQAIPAPQSRASYSGTNIQEEGVDEADTIKTDGRRLVTMTPSRLSILTVDSSSARLRGSIEIADGVGMFLDGNRIIHVASEMEGTDDARVVRSPLGRSWTKVSIVDVSDPDHPSIAASLSVEGAYIGARLVDGVVRLVVRSSALGPAPVPITDGTQKSLDRAEAANKRAIRLSGIGNWVPHYVLRLKSGVRAAGHLHDWTSVIRPPDNAGIAMLTVLTIDPAHPRPNNVTSVLGAGQIVYATPTSLYVTSNRLDEMNGGFAPIPAAITRIHKFDISDPLKASYVASGEVAGYLLNQFSMSEQDGLLRVASTLDAPALPETAASQSLVTVLSPRAGKLVPIGKVENLGSGERIYSVRFIGTKGYVVTFRQVDPLHVIDLSDPRKPALVGELRVPGYSGYLHPIDEKLLIGVGREADEQGQAKGLRMSLFDVSDPANPRLLHEATFGVYGYSRVEHDHHAFLYWAPKDLVVVPASITDKEDSPAFEGAVAVTVTEARGFAHEVRLTHSTKSKEGSTAILRSLVIGDNLVTISDAGVLVSDLDSYVERDWVALPA